MGGELAQPSLFTHNCLENPRNSIGRKFTLMRWDLIVSQLNYSLDNIYHIHRAVSALERVPGK